MIGLYERNDVGMNFDYILNFNFSILDSNDKFNLSNFETTDGYINKYPPRKKDATISPIGLYYYTFRDFNSLRKNASFMNKPHYNAIVVTVSNFCKYAYLYALKTLFQPENSWLYGNLSPLINRDLLEKNKNIFVQYSIRTNPILKNMDKEIIREITKHYGVDFNNLTEIKKLEIEINKHFKTLIPSSDTITKIEVEPPKKHLVNYLRNGKNGHHKQLMMAMERKIKYKTKAKKNNEKVLA